MAAPRKENIRDAILDATSELLRETDFENISLAKIANAAGVSKGTIYYYYSNKDDILFDVADRYLNGLMDELIQWVDNRDKDTSLVRMIGFVLQRGMADEFGNLRLYLIGASVSGHDALRRRYVDLYAQFQRTLASRISQRAPQADADYIAWLILVITDGLLIQKQLDPPNFSSEDFLNKSVKLLDFASKDDFMNNISQ